MSSAYEPRDVPRDEAEAALATRHELGRDYEPAIVDSFVDRIDKVIEARVSERLAQRSVDRALPDRTGFALAIVSLGCGIPLSAIAGGIADLPGILIAWIGIVLVNLAYALQNRRQP